MITRCWRQVEGNYRDDITAIVVFLPSIFTRLVAARGDSTNLTQSVHTPSRRSLGARASACGRDLDSSDVHVSIVEAAYGQSGPGEYSSEQRSTAAAATAAAATAVGATAAAATAVGATAASLFAQRRLSYFNGPPKDEALITGPDKPAVDKRYLSRRDMRGPRAPRSPGKRGGRRL